MAYRPNLRVASTFSAASKIGAWEQDRLEFFKAVKANDAPATDAMITKYPNEWKKWCTKEGTPLFLAQTKGNFDVFTLLLERGANINEDFGRGWTPITTAYKKKQGQFFDYLLENGADLNAKPSTSNTYSFKTTLLHLAVSRGDKDTLLRLIERGADTSISLSMGGLGGAFYIGSVYGCTAESLAAKKGRDVFADILKRADVIRAEYLATLSQQPPATVPAVAAATDPATGKIDVMAPVQLKKPAAGAS